MKIAFVGCGYVADLYARTLPWHAGLELSGVMDRDPERARRFSAYWSTRRYENLEQVLEDRTVGIIVNLTHPTAHHEVSRACLEAGKHVYSEKPLAMGFGEARELVELAEARGLHIVSAPCTLLGEAAQTVWRALREDRVGAVRVVYAEMDDGPVHRMPYRSWESESGAPWPYRSEFEIGCTLEHAGYHVSWMAAFFGPARSVTAVSAVQVPDKGVDPPLEANAPDFSVACIRFASGVTARLTCSIIARPDHSLRIVGDEGVLTVADTWHNRSPVYLQRWLTFRRRTRLSPWRRKVRPLRRSAPRVARRGASAVDFVRGIADLAEAVTRHRSPQLSARFSLHVNEVVLSIHEATEQGASREITSTFDPIEPVPWVAS